MFFKENTKTIQLLEAFFMKAKFWELFCFDGPMVHFGK